MTLYEPINTQKVNINPPAQNNTNTSPEVIRVICVIQINP